MSVLGRDLDLGYRVHIERFPGVLWLRLVRLERLHHNVWDGEVGIEVGGGEGRF